MKAKEYQNLAMRTNDGKGTDQTAIRPVCSADGEE